MLNRLWAARGDTEAPSASSRSDDEDVIAVVACPNPACTVGLRIPTKKRLKVVCPQCHTRFMFDSSLEASWNVHIPEGQNGAWDLQAPACDQPKMREFMGLAGVGFPWASATGLLYPIGATIYIVSATPAGPAMVTGYGLANLGYLLFAAGVFGGTFRIFGLRKRTQVFGAAVLSFVLGTLLSNVGS